MKLATETDTQNAAKKVEEKTEKMLATGNDAGKKLAAATDAQIAGRRSQKRR